MGLIYTVIRKADSDLTSLVYTVQKIARAKNVGALRHILLSPTGVLSKVFILCEEKYSLMYACVDKITNIMYADISIGLKTGM